MSGRSKLRLPLAAMSALALASAGPGVGAAAEDGTTSGRGPGANSAAIVPVGDYGAVPDDGVDDTAAIQQAIDAAGASNDKSVVTFEAGIYRLGAATDEALLHLAGLRNVTLRGATGADGKPATVLQVNHELANDVSGAAGAGHFAIENSKNIELDNLVLDYGPRFASAGEIVSVDEANDTVVADIFPGMPAFEGMRAYSANSWDLATKHLIHVDALTIGTDLDKFTHTWTRVPGTDNRYQIQGMGFSGRVEPGQGISWHFNVDTASPNLSVMHSENVTLDNVSIPNSLGMSMLAGYNKNMTLRHVRVEPEGNSLAVGPRDGFHFSNNRGSLLLDDVTIRGVRWDPFVVRSTFLDVRDVSADHKQIRAGYATGDLVFQAGDTVTFWVGDQPIERQIEAAQAVGPAEYAMTFADALPDAVAVGSRLTHNGYEWDSVVVRNGTFEDNFGTPIVFMGKNLLVENNLFNNNAYSNIGLGPTSVNTGPFARDVVIRNNVFEQSTWIDKYPGYEGTITTFENHPAFTNEKLNANIAIQNNTFRNLDVAVQLKNVRGVALSGNVYAGVTTPIKANTASAEQIANDDGVPIVDQGGEALLPADAVVVNLGSPQYAESGGTWQLSSLTGYGGSYTRYTGSAQGQATWTPDLAAGTYQVLLYRVAYPTSETAVKLAVHHKNGVAETVSDFSAGDPGWIDLGTFEFDAGAAGYVTLSRANPLQPVGYLRTNAVAFIPVDG